MCLCVFGSVWVGVQECVCARRVWVGVLECTCVCVFVWICVDEGVGVGVCIWACVRLCERDRKGERERDNVEEIE